jgi:outer membrane biosynthesis protein TonB
MLSTANLPAQDARKAITNPAPPYPEVAEKFRLAGILKVQVVIAAEGHVKSVRAIALYYERFTVRMILCYL